MMTNPRDPQELARETPAELRSGESAMDDTMVAALRARVPEWRIFERDGVAQLERTFAFRDFAQALAFTDAVGALAEAAQHHPAILTEWGKTTVTWWTHTVKGLHRNDFIMAARTDGAYEPAGP